MQAVYGCLENWGFLYFYKYIEKLNLEKEKRDGLGVLCCNSDNFK